MASRPPSRSTLEARPRRHMFTRRRAPSKARPSAANKRTGSKVFNMVKLPQTAHIYCETGLNVGGGLPPKAVGQLQLYHLARRHRGQAPSHLFGRVHLVRNP